MHQEIFFLDRITLTTLLRTEPSHAPGALAIATGESTTCAVLTGSKVYCWGCNSNGQLGTGDTLDRYMPTAVTPAAGANATEAAPAVAVDASYDSNQTHAEVGVCLVNPCHWLMGAMIVLCLCITLQKMLKLAQTQL
jgi:hypothetical protein